MRLLPTIDAHAHIDPARATNELAGSGAVLAMTLSLHEAALAIGRHERYVTWGVGCHPRKLKVQDSFDVERFRQLAKKAAVVGEIGLDKGSRVPLEVQLKNFRQTLEVISDLPRFVSIGRALRRKHGRPLPLGVTSPFILLSLATLSSAPLSHLSACSLKVIMATSIRRLPSPVVLSGRSISLPNN